MFIALRLPCWSSARNLWPSFGNSRNHPLTNFMKLHLDCLSHMSLRLLVCVCALLCRYDSCAKCSQQIPALAIFLSSVLTCCVPLQKEANSFLTNDMVSASLPWPGHQSPRLSPAKQLGAQSMMFMPFLFGSFCSEASSSATNLLYLSWQKQ